VVTRSHIPIQIDRIQKYFRRLWGDSFLGEVVDNKRADSSPFIMGNVWQLLDGESVKTITGGTAVNPESLLKTENVDGYRPSFGLCTVLQRTISYHVFMSTIVKTGMGTWDFYWHSTLYYRLNLSDLSVMDKQELLTREQTDDHSALALQNTKIFTISMVQILKKISRRHCM